MAITRRNTPLAGTVQNFGPPPANDQSGEDTGYLNQQSDPLPSAGLPEPSPPIAEMPRIIGGAAGAGASPTPGNSGPAGNSDKPADLFRPQAPTSLGNLVGGGGSPAGNAPSRPNEPTPVAGGTPSPNVQPPPTFEPMRSGMSPNDQTMSTIVRRGLVPGGPNQQGGALLGKAGGLLGGGLGVPGVMGDTGGQNISDLIAQIMLMANR